MALLQCVSIPISYFPKPLFLPSIPSSCNSNSFNTPNFRLLVSITPLSVYPVPHIPKLRFSLKKKFKILATGKYTGISTYRSNRSKPQPRVPDAPVVEEGRYGFHLESAINQLSALAPRASIARCLGNWKNKLSMQDFLIIFKEFAQRGDWQKSFRLFKFMQKQDWCQPNEQIYIMMIGILGREGMVDKCLELFEEMPLHDIEWNVFSFTALINAYARNIQYKEALELLDRMRDEGISPNIITYNSILSSCAKGDYSWDGLLDIYAQMREEDIEPDLMTYNTLLSACESRSLVEEAAMVFRTMNELSIAPDSLSYSTLISIFSKTQNLNEVMLLFQEMEEEGIIPDVKGYNLLIEAFCKQRLYKEAGMVLSQMESVGCKPTTSTYSILLSMYGQQGKYEEVKQLFEQMKSKGTATDVITFKTLAHVFGSGGFFKEIVSLYNDLIESDIKADVDIYSSLISSCSKGGLYKECYQIYKHMLISKITPTAEIFANLIDVFGTCSMYKDALNMISSSKEMGLDVSMEGYKFLIDAYSKGGLANESISAYGLMVEDGKFDADVDIFNSLIESFEKSGQFTESIAVYDDLREAQQDPNQRTHECMLSVYSSAGMADEAIAQFLEMKELELTPSPSCFCHVIAICARRKRQNDLDRIMDDLRSIHNSQKHYFVHELMSGNFGVGSNWQILEHSLDMFKSEGLKSNMSFYNSLFEALWCLNLKKTSFNLFKELKKRNIFSNSFSNSSFLWAIDLHRLSPGLAICMLIDFLITLQEKSNLKEKFPPVLSIVTRWGSNEPENLKELEKMPVRKSVKMFLKEVDSPFKQAEWNRSKLICYNDDSLHHWLNGPNLERIVESIIDDPFSKPS